MGTSNLINYVDPRYYLGLSWIEECQRLKCCKTQRAFSLIRRLIKLFICCPKSSGAYWPRLNLKTVKGEKECAPNWKPYGNWANKVEMDTPWCELRKWVFLLRVCGLGKLMSHHPLRSAISNTTFTEAQPCFHTWLSVYISLHPNKKWVLCISFHSNAWTLRRTIQHCGSRVAQSPQGPWCMPRKTAQQLHHS